MPIRHNAPALGGELVQFLLQPSMRHGGYDLVLVLYGNSPPSQLYKNVARTLEFVNG